MSPRARTLAFGSAVLVAVAGALCAAFIGGLAGVVLGVALITVGLGAVVLLVFLEVGLSEDHAREREEREERGRRAPPAQPPHASRVDWARRRPRRPR